MTRHPALRAGRCLLVAALPLLLASKCYFAYTSSDESPPPTPPPDAYVSIDSPPTKLDTASASLQGEAECPDCFASDWQYGSCPVIECPSAAGLGMSWTNHTTGASGTPTHGVFATCNCPWPWGYGYCYSACRHAWWATVPLAWGDNDVEVLATAPGYAPGGRSVSIQRVPLAPSWTDVQPGPGSVQLAWTAVEGATSYNLYWSTTPYGWAALCTKIENVTSPYLHAGLPGGVTTYYYVTALAGTAESFDSQRTEAIPQ